MSPQKLLLDLLISSLLATCFCSTYENSNQFLSSGRVDCTCPGDTLTFTCTVMNTSQITVWSGTAIRNHCVNNEITFLHLSMNFETQNENCSNGAIVGQAQTSENSVCYTSTLTVTISESFNNQTVECGHDNGVVTTVVDASTITVVSATQLTLGLYVAEVNTGQLTLSWNPVARNCSVTVVYYALITTPECGECMLLSPRQNAATCYVKPSPSSGLCTVTVQSFVCSNFKPTLAESVNATLKVPDIPTVNYVPLYSVKNRSLLSISFTINKEEPFNISGDIEASILFYNISFSECSSNTLCSSSMLSTSELSCIEDNIYNVEIEIDLVACQCSSASINFTVFAINQLGNGLETPTVTLGQLNDFVSVTYDSSTYTITCIFLNKLDESEKSCSILYGTNPLQLNSTTQNISTSTYITLVLSLVDVRQTDYHYVITAANSSYTVRVKGTLNSTNNPSVGSPLDNTSAIVGSVFGVIIVLTIVIVLLAVVAFRLKVCNNQANVELDVEETHSSTGPSFNYNEVTLKLEVIGNNGESTNNTNLNQSPPPSCSHVEISPSDDTPMYVEVSSEATITTAPVVVADDSFEAVVDSATMASVEYSLHLMKTVDCNGTMLQVLYVNQDCELEEFVSTECELAFKRGCAYYEFTHDQERISEKQQVLLYNKETGEFLTGPEALQMIDAPGENVQRPQCDKYKVFVQSIGSGARHLDPNSIVLYKDCSNLVANEELTQEAHDNLIAVHPDIYEMFPLEFDCTFESFCRFKNFKSTKDRRVYVELSRIISCGDIQDAVVINKASGRYFTGYGAKEISLRLKKLMDDQRSSLPNPSDFANSGYQENLELKELTQKWLVLVACKFQKSLYLHKGTHVLYLSNKSTSETVDNVSELKVDDCVQLSRFVRQNLSDTFDGDKVFFEFAREKEDILADAEIILMHKETLVFTRLIDKGVCDKIPGAPGLGVKRPTLENHRIFIKCKSQGSQCLRVGTSVLYKDAEDNKDVKVTTHT